MGWITTIKTRLEGVGGYMAGMDWKREKKSKYGKSSVSKECRPGRIIGQEVRLVPWKRGFTVGAVSRIEGMVLEAKTRINNVKQKPGRNERVLMNGPNKYFQGSDCGEKSEGRKWGGGREKDRSVEEDPT